MTRPIFLLAASSLLIAACSQTVFLVQRDVPSSPTFTVIPANDYLYQVDFATQIEGHLISCGVKVTLPESPNMVSSVVRLCASVMLIRLLYYYCRGLSTGSL